jgi:hypothetical protein
VARLRRRALAAGALRAQGVAEEMVPQAKAPGTSLQRLSMLASGRDLPAIRRDAGTRLGGESLVARVRVG